MEKYSIEAFEAHHREEDDEMIGIRELTDNYHVDRNTGTYTKVLFSELENFEKELHIHARIENEILFPKALKMEEDVKNQLSQKIALN